jgi:hypothetical protein
LDCSGGADSSPRWSPDPRRLLDWVYGFNVLDLIEWALPYAQESSPELDEAISSGSGYALARCMQGRPVNRRRPPQMHGQETRRP